MIKKITTGPYKKIYVYAVGQHIPMSADKARRVVDQIRGRSYDTVVTILELMPYRACYPILKLVYSAASNASHNSDFKEKDLYIRRAEVEEGTTVKKLKPRARGRGFPLKRTSCHITIELVNASLGDEIASYGSGGRAYRYMKMIDEIKMKRWWPRIPKILKILKI